MTDTPDPSRSVIVLGAGSDRSRFSNKAVRCYAQLGFTVYPVNPKETEVEGWMAFPDIGAVDGRADLLLLYVRPEVGLKVIDQAPARGVRDVYVNPGSGNPDLVGRIRELGMNPIEACSIVATGRLPGDFTD